MQTGLQQQVDECRLALEEKKKKKKKKKVFKLLRGSPSTQVMQHS